MPLGALAGGLIASRWGLAAPFWIGGVVLAVVAAPMLPGIVRGVSAATGPGSG